MFWRQLIYGCVCLACVCYLAIANARGYVPFATPTTQAIQGTANHFHK